MSKVFRDGQRVKNAQGDMIELPPALTEREENAALQLARSIGKERAAARASLKDRLRAYMVGEPDDEEL